MNRTVRYRVESSTHPGKKYVVKHQGNKWSCGCKGWTQIFPRQDCKHIKKIKRDLHLRVDLTTKSGYSKRARNRRGEYVSLGGKKKRIGKVKKRATKLHGRSTKSRIRHHKKTTRNPRKVGVAISPEIEVGEPTNLPTLPQASHFTVRMAWHDSNWNGMICKDPIGNYYCTGSHSLLSERIARKKLPQLEADHKGEKLDSLLPKYLPPCFWTSSAFSPQLQSIVHDHPFLRYEGRKSISQSQESYSVYSWPFRLSFTHSKKKKEAEGSYPKDLPQRIKNFVGKFEPNQSIVFFYLNYDNPISGDDERYLLVGCAVVDKRPKVPSDFDFSDDEWEKERNRSNDMKNFPKMNWAINVSYDFENTRVVLPYQRYLDHAKAHPEEKQKLEELKVLIEEDSLVFGFKYVLADIDEDQCILLLTKLKKAANVIQSHGLVDFTREQALIDNLLRKSWLRRGLYPGLPAVLDTICGNADGIGKAILDTATKYLPSDGDLCENVFRLIGEEKPPTYLGKLKNEISDIRKNLKQYSASIGLLKKLSLFSLKRKQVENVIRQDEDSFSIQRPLGEIETNPYILAEEYKHETSTTDLDQEVMEDGPIDLFRIDIGMFPDKIVGTSPMQDLPIASPERLRAIIREHLRSVGSDGHCFSSLDEVFDSILDHPLFYKREIVLNKDQLLSPDYLAHFTKKLVVRQNEGSHYFYLREVAYSEDLIKKVVTELVNRADHTAEIQELGAYLAGEADKLEARGVKGFERSRFIDERTKLLSNVLKRSFYVVSGRPGSGKTRVLEKVLLELEKMHESAIVLTPTGKAAIRLKLEAKAKNPRTIDKFVRDDEGDYWRGLDDFATIESLDGPKSPMENLIIDESSMVDLQKLSVLFSMLELKGEKMVKRVILVGDENQLPPIGFGRPFYDIIQFLRTNPSYLDKNHVRLLTNCRHETDPEVLRLAEVFTEKNRYYDEALDKVSSANGDLSVGLAVERWSDRDELHQKIKLRLSKLFEGIPEGEKGPCADDKEIFSVLIGLYNTGYVRNGSAKSLEAFQILTPYRTEAFGSLGLNRFIKSEYRKGHFADRFFKSQFIHSDKVIRTANEYAWNRERNRRELRLSNGSIGVINNKKSAKGMFYRMYYFTDLEQPLFSWGRGSFKEDEDLELAYAITVHKAQGSDFDNVFVVVPNKTRLLSKELVYTALTRSKRTMTLLLQKGHEFEVLNYARSHSELLKRNTSIFELPENSKEILEPETGVPVKSKIEYIVYKALQSSGLRFGYEDPLSLKVGPDRIKPDFTIYLDGTYYWEHLGELDVKEYWSKWIARRDWYKANGLFDKLITTDDLGGVRHEMVLKVIDDIRNGRPITTEGNEFSNHHYRLYD